ncbi:MAG: hypothetical protein H7070_07575 [Saprospiraceae bacterium]|nr:hypothetical protein [Pyrinomonadaceae bacterium]
MRNILILILALALAAIALACGSSASDARTPTEAYKRFYAAVKSKNIEAIKAEMSKNTLALAASETQRRKITMEKVLENGLTATTFAETLPEIRDERVSGDSGSVEVWNAKDSIWEDLPFIKEDGVWKFAIGDLFSGSFTSPGKGRAMKEREAANAMANAVPVPTANVNTASVANESMVEKTARRSNTNK